MTINFECSLDQQSPKRQTKYVKSRLAVIKLISFELYPQPNPFAKIECINRYERFERASILALAKICEYKAMLKVIGIESHN